MSHGASATPTTKANPKLQGMAELDINIYERSKLNSVTRHKERAKYDKVSTLALFLHNVTIAFKF